MPELPEAETIVRQIRPSLVGVRLGSVRHVRADVVRGGSAAALKRTLRGARVRDVSRRGKRVLIELDSGDGLVIGLGMSGHVSVCEARESPAKHTHLRVPLEDGKRELRFRDARRFGGLWLLRGHDQGHAGFKLLGPEPLVIELAEFRRLMCRRRQIKALLMDQASLAGMGNIYCDEALFRAGIHPLTRAADLSSERVRNLRRAIRRVLREAIAAEGSSVNSYMTAEGRPGGFQFKLRVYDRAGEPCTRCGAPIERIQAAGRTTHYCPRCQKNSEFKTQNSKSES